MRTSCLPILSASSLAVLAIAVSPRADATTFRNTSAGTACHAANGAVAASFVRSGNYITNTSSSTQFVICHFGMHDTDGLKAVTLFQIAISSTQPARTVVCTAQTGSYHHATNNVTSSVARSYTFPAVGWQYLQWTASALTRSVYWDVLTLNCRMDPGTRLGVIEYHQAT